MLRQRNDGPFGGLKQQKPDQQFVVHVCDQLGNDGLDYQIDFHVFDDTIQKRSWNKAPEDAANSPVFKELQEWADDTAKFQNKLIADVVCSPSASRSAVPLRSCSPVGSSRSCSKSVKRAAKARIQW